MTNCALLALAVTFAHAAAGSEAQNDPLRASSLRGTASLTATRKLLLNETCYSHTDATDDAPPFTIDCSSLNQCDQFDPEYECYPDKEDAMYWGSASCTEFVLWYANQTSCTWAYNCCQHVP
jgi:hypothetical protein